MWPFRIRASGMKGWVEGLCWRHSVNKWSSAQHNEKEKTVRLFDEQILCFLPRNCWWALWWHDPPLCLSFSSPRRCRSSSCSCFLLSVGSSGPGEERDLSHLLWTRLVPLGSALTVLSLRDSRLEFSRFWGSWRGAGKDKPSGAHVAPSPWSRIVPQMRQPGVCHPVSIYTSFSEATCILMKIAPHAARCADPSPGSEWEIRANSVPRTTPAREAVGLCHTRSPGGSRQTVTRVAVTFFMVNVVCGSFGQGL